MRTVLLAGLLGVCTACGAATVARPARAKPVTLRIQKLTGRVAKLGSMSGLPLYGVRLRATLCISDPGTAPDAIGVTHYAVSHHGRTWWEARAVVDHAPWLVPFGETWPRGSHCGPVRVEDAVPPTHYGVESLGNPSTCYGVRLSIKVGRAHASKRAIIRCHGF
jgi:hypothetical protein